MQDVHGGIKLPGDMQDGSCLTLCNLHTSHLLRGSSSGCVTLTLLV